MKPTPSNNDNQRQGSPSRSTGKVRNVERLSIPVRQTFDQQFWPVLIALMIFSGIAAGAIVTLMTGTRMWIALLALPAVTAALMYLLYRMDQSRIGRTFQFAILVTFAFHLLLLIFASFIILFNNPYQAPQRQIAQKQQNTLIVSRQQQPHVWQQSQKRSVANPNVEVQRQQSQTATRSQTIPVENSQPTPTPQTVRRESRESTIPRLDRELSQLRRSRSNAKPKSSVASMSSASSAKSKPTRETRLQKTESAAASNVQRRSTAAPATRTDSRVEATAATSPAPSPSKRREREIAASPAPAAESKATIRRRSAQVPSSTTAKIAEASSSKPTKSKSRDAEPNVEPTADKIARKSSTSSAEKQVTTTATKSRRSDVAKSQRRESPVTQQTLSKPNVDSPQPRKSVRQSDIASTVALIDAPANPQSAKASRPQPSPQALAVSKSERGTAGAGRSPNLESAVGGQRSPAHVASDSSRDQRRENTLANNISLSSQQHAEAGRSTARSLKPTSSFKAETADMAKIAGSSLLSLKSESSSAANIDSATKIDRSKSIAEKGQSSLDLGPTKVLNDQVAQRRGGGGMPQIAPAAPAKQASGRSKSQQVPSQIAAASVETKGPLDPSSMPATSGAKVNDEVNEVAKSQPSESSRPQAAPNMGVESEFEASMADSKSERASDAVGEIQSLEPATEESQTGNKRTRIALAPRRSKTETNLGLQDPKSGVSPSKSLRPREGNSIAAELIDRASNAIPGAALAKTATGALAQAATSMPVIDTSGTGRRRAKDADDLAPANAASARSTARTKTNLPRSNGVASVKTNSPKNTGKSIEVSPDAPSDSTGIVRSNSSAAGAELEIQAEVGPAGLSEMPSRTLGVTTRPATKNSPLIAMASDTRFKKRTFGGLPSFSPPAVMAREAFRQRRSAAKAKSAPSTEAAIESGLEFLARFQASDGSWSLSQFDVDHPMHRTQLNSDAAATGLAMLAFQGAGYNHREFKYADQLQRAADWMAQNQAADGGLYLDADEKSNNSSRMYSHAIAALALTEAYGMTQDPKLRRPAQKAIDYIQSTQDPNRGGWRYFAQPNNMRSTDTSVTGWMMMALQSARLSGLKIDDQTMRGIDSWLNMAAIGESEFSYNPLANDAPGVSRQHGRNASNSMTAVGLLMRIYGGWNRFDPRFQMGAIKLLEQMPSDANAKVRDTYYWYYATQVMKHVGGDAWNQWNNQLQPLLVGSQERVGNMRGSWNPYEPVPDRWGPHGGRLYVTTMNLLSLEVRYRLLPLYDQTINK